MTTTNQILGRDATRGKEVGAGGVEVGPPEGFDSLTVPLLVQIDSNSNSSNSSQEGNNTPDDDGGGVVTLDPFS